VTRVLLHVEKFFIKCCIFCVFSQVTLCSAGECKTLDCATSVVFFPPTHCVCCECMMDACKLDCGDHMTSRLNSLS